MEVQPRNHEELTRVPVVTMKQLLEAGVHFGHQTRRWNPKMRRFIFGERNGIYIIDLQQSLSKIDNAYEFVRDTVAHGGTVLFVGTKRQAQEQIADGSLLMSRRPPRVLVSFSFSRESWRVSFLV